MVKKINLLSICLIFFVVCGFSGCAGLGIKIDTKEKNYLVARSELNLLLEFYIDLQDTVSVEKQKEAKTAFTIADTALDAWELGLTKENYNPTIDLQSWLNAKKVIIQIIKEKQDA